MGKIKILNEYNIEELGQVFTPSDISDKMISLIKNGKYSLEPSAGDGSFYKKLKNSVGIEFDEKFCPDGCLNIDFFDYNIEIKHDTIIGNPPYVAFKKILSSTKSKLDMTLFDNRTNLYLFFIYKCFKQLEENGELIFITPPDFLKSTSSLKLNNLLYENGTITDYYEYNDMIVFKKFSPNVAIWRYEKNNFIRKTKTNDGEKKFQNINGQLIFSNIDYDLNLKDHFIVKVGGVSGLDEVFINDNGNKDFVCSFTKKTGLLKRMFYNIKSEYLLPYKEKLINRKIKNFNENNWYMWGRDYYKSDKERIYVNCKTRNDDPFFYNECKDFDGSILAIIPKKSIDIIKCVEVFNKINWIELGFKQGGRYIFSQKSLENIKLPSELFSELL